MLHRGEAKIFREFNIFDMKNNRMEYEANSFAAEVALPDEEILEYIYEGCDIGVIAKSMYSDINLVALKVGKFQPARVFFPATGQQIGLPQIRKLTKEWDQHKVFVLIPF